MEGMGRKEILNTVIVVGQCHGAEKKKDVQEKSGWQKEEKTPHQRITAEDKREENEEPREKKSGHGRTTICIEFPSWGRRISAVWSDIVWIDIRRGLRHWFMERVLLAFIGVPNLVAVQPGKLAGKWLEGKIDRSVICGYSYTPQYRTSRDQQISSVIGGFLLLPI